MKVGYLFIYLYLGFPHQTQSILETVASLNNISHKVTNTLEIQESLPSFTFMKIPLFSLNSRNTLFSIKIQLPINKQTNITTP